MPMVREARYLKTSASSPLPSRKFHHNLRAIEFGADHRPRSAVCSGRVIDIHKAVFDAKFALKPATQCLDPIALSGMVARRKVMNAKLPCKVRSAFGNFT